MIVEIVGYKESWTAEFGQRARHLRASLGAAALRIDHVGSTAVSGLAAKDCLDVQISVAGDAGLEAATEALAACGYVHIAENGRDHVPAGAPADEHQWRKRFFREPPGERRANIHVRVDGSANQRYALLFRDYLRAHRDAAAAYERLKREIASRHGDDLAAYVEIKDPACDLIVFAAERWASACGWAPGDSDG